MLVGQAHADLSAGSVNTQPASHFIPGPKVRKAFVRSFMFLPFDGATQSESAISCTTQNPTRPVRINAEKSGDPFAARAAELICSRCFNSGN